MYTPYQTPPRESLIASFMLVLALLQGSSFTLTLAIRSVLASNLASSLVTLLWLAMYMVAGTALVATSGINWITWLVRYRLALVLLLAGTTFSIFWSVDSGLTTERVVHLVGTSLVAIYLGFTLSLPRILKVSATVLGLLMVASVAAALWLPSLGLENYEGQIVWAGVFATKNTLGFWASISVLLLVSLTFWHITTFNRLLYIGFALISIVCLYNSVSATSALALVSAAVVMIYLHICYSLRLGIVAVLFLGTLAAVLVGMLFSNIETAELIGRSGDLTGRGEVWEQTWQLILQRPLTGFGYGTIWYPTEESVHIQQRLTDFSWTVYHAHNGLLQIASEIGLPLTLIAFLMIVQQLVEIVYCQFHRQQPGVLFVLGFTVALLVSNFSEARLLINRELYWVLFIALPISMIRQLTVAQPRAVVASSPVMLPAELAERLENARKKRDQHRILKSRLRKQRRVTIINTSDSVKNTGSEQSEARISAQPAGTEKIRSITRTALLDDDSKTALKQKQVKRRR